MSYQLVPLRFLGSGGHADIYVAQRTDTGEQVAVKMLRDHARPEERKAFLNEARILGLGVPGLIRLLSSNMEADRPFYEMPLMGGCLRPHAGKLNDRQLHAVAIELAQTLMALHATRDAHGDIKPDNILLSYNGQLQVADPLGNGAHCTVWFAENRGGTPGYWAPEIRANKPISSTGDVYSYGATLYELLTGKRPQDGQRLDPSAEGFAKSPKICEIIAACCQFDPAARPSMQEVVRMLNGEQWVNIQASRIQRQQFFAGSIVVSLIALALWGFRGIKTT
jgi:serine/threonine protein kinase